MEWTRPTPPTTGISHYTHIISDTPMGKMKIEWKSWKEHPSYDIQLNDDWIGAEYDLESSKILGEKYLKDKLKELEEFLK